MCYVHIKRLKLIKKKLLHVFMVYHHFFSRSWRRLAQQTRSCRRQQPDASPTSDDWHSPTRRLERSKAAEHRHCVVSVQVSCHCDCVLHPTANVDLRDSIFISLRGFRPLKRFVSYFYTFEKHPNIFFKHLQTLIRGCYIEI